MATDLIPGEHAAEAFCEAWSLARLGGLFDEFCDDLVRCLFVGFGVEVSDDAVPHDGTGDRSNVILIRVQAALDRSSGFRGQNKVLAGSRSGSPGHVLFDELRGLGVVVPRKPRE